MGDIIGGVMGGGEQQEQETRATAETKALNRLKLKELRKLFAVADMEDFGGRNTRDFTLDPRTQQLINRAMSGDNMMSLDQYMQAGLDEGSNYISKVATPEIMSTLALQGMERSGAAPEAIAKATAGVALPFLQSVPNFMGANAVQAQTLAGLSDMPRALRAQDLMRRQGLVETAWTGIPVAPTSRTEGGTSSLPLWNMFGLGGSL